MGGKWSKYKASTSSLRCTNSVFGDPWPGKRKACYCKQSGLATGFDLGASKYRCKCPWGMFVIDPKKNGNGRLLGAVGGVPATATTACRRARTRSRR